MQSFEESNSKHSKTLRVYFILNQLLFAKQPAPIHNILADVVMWSGSRQLLHILNSLVCTMSPDMYGRFETQHDAMTVFEMNYLNKLLLLLQWTTLIFYNVMQQFIVKIKATATMHRIEGLLRDSNIQKAFDSYIMSQEHRTWRLWAQFVLCDFFSY